LLPEKTVLKILLIYWPIKSGVSNTVVNFWHKIGEKLLCFKTIDSICGIINIFIVKVFPLPEEFLFCFRCGLIQCWWYWSNKKGLSAGSWSQDIYRNRKSLCFTWCYNSLLIAWQLLLFLSNTCFQLDLFDVLYLHNILRQRYHRITLLYYVNNCSYMCLHDLNGNWIENNCFKYLLRYLFYEHVTSHNAVSIYFNYNYST
jgi:hypothetical protein